MDDAVQMLRFTSVRARNVCQASCSKLGASSGHTRTHACSSTRGARKRVVCVPATQDWSPAHRWGLLGWRPAGHSERRLMHREGEVVEQHSVIFLKNGSNKQKHGSSVQR